MCLFRTAELPIRYHVKIRSDATPYDPEFREYFADRYEKRKRSTIADRIKLSQSAIEAMVA